MLQLISIIPDDKSVIDEIIFINKEMIKLKSKLDLKDIPEDVKEFLDKINRLNEFSIDKFSSSVKDWLKDKGMLNQFVIKRK